MKRILGLSKGQIAVLYAGILAVLLGAVALGTDVGVMYYQWMALQKGIDFAALAGVNSLPDAPATAATAVTAYANNNGVKTAEISAITCIDAANKSYSCSNTASQPAGFTPIKVQVDAARVVPYYFAKALGMTSATLNVSSTALHLPPPSCLNCCIVNCNSSSPPGSPGGPSPSNVPVSGASGCETSPATGDIIPIALDDQTARSWANNTPYTFNRVTAPNGGNGPWPDAPGNWGGITLCGGGNGGSGLRTQIANGYRGSMSSTQTVTTNPGAKVGPIDQGFADWLSASTNNWTSFQTNPSVTDKRVVMVPLADFSHCSGQCNLPITGFMSFYITSYSNGAISGYFIDVTAPDSVRVVNTVDAGLSGEPKLVN
jgi:Flp pilus assembly protein TadG